MFLNFKIIFLGYFKSYLDLDSLYYRQLVLEDSFKAFGLDGIAVKLSVEYERPVSEFRRNDRIGFSYTMMTNQDELGGYFEESLQGIRFTNRKGYVLIINFYYCDSFFGKIILPV